MPEHAASDVSRYFIDTVERAGDWWPEYVPWTADLAEQIRLEADEMIRSIADECGVRDLNRIKPGIAEATRAILRRVPDRIYVQRRDDPDVAHICLLADKAGVRDRKSVVEGKSVSVRVDRGGRRSLKKKIQKKTTQ